MAEAGTLQYFFLMSNWFTLAITVTKILGGTYLLDYLETNQPGCIGIFEVIFKVIVSEGPSVFNFLREISN